MPVNYKTPHQKIFTEKKDLNLFLLKVVSFLTYKKIPLPDILDLPSNEPGLPRFIKVWTQPDAIDDINKALYPPQLNDLKALGFIRLQTSEEGKSLLNYFNIRISLGFKVDDLTNLFIKLASRPIADPERPNQEFFLKTVPNSSETPTREFLFCYLNIWPYVETWKLTISKGDSDYIKYNVLAQDLISDYFQSGIYIPKPDYNENNE